MGVDAEDLFLGPFREVAERGKEAVVNAQDIEDVENEEAKYMLKAAQAVAKEGERALKRLQPLWDGQVGRYGDVFTDALSQNGEIEAKRHQLEDLLYDFEDYIEADTFELERFTEVQVATKSLALQVIDFIKKTKLETPKSAAYVVPSSSKFPPLPPLPTTTPSTRSPSISSASGNPVGRASSRHRRPPTPGGERAEQNESPPPPLPTPSLPQRSPDRVTGPLSKGDPASSGPPPECPDTAPHPLRVPTARRTYDRLNANSVRSHRSNGTSRSRISQVSLGSLESQPPPYTAGEATVSVAPAAPQDEPSQPPSRDSTPDRLPELPRPHPHTASREDHHQHASPTGQAGTETSNVNYSAFPIPRQGQNSNGTRITAWMLEQANSGSRNQSQAHRPSARYEPHSLQAIKSLQALTIPEDKAVGVVRPKHASVIDFSPLTPMLAQLGQFSIDSSTASSPSMSNDASVSQQSRMSPLSQSTSFSSPQYKNEPPLPFKTPEDTIETRLDPVRQHALTPLILPAAAIDHSHRPQLPSLSSTSETHSPLPLTSEPPAGAIPEEWATVVSDHTSFTTPSFSSSALPAPQPRDADISLGPRCSLYALGGFCPSSQTFKSTSHQDGIRKLAGHVAGVSTFTARCETCSYGHAFTELDLDVNQKSPRATFPRPHGVLFRIRFLYKSHLASQRPSEAFYGCLFCAQTGAVTREGDATVFRSSDDLLRHLAHHPQPLPEVSGVTVLYGKEVLASDPRVHDFDLWLTEDPASPPKQPVDLAMLPVATAGRSHVQRYAEKKLARPDGKRNAELLQFFVGARVVGIEFPPAWAGKWATGWHDGEWGYFPAKTIELEKPKPGRLDAPPMQFQGVSAVSVSVVARWKFDPAASIRDAAEKGWIGFDKGERITNVGWPVVVEGVGGGGREAWCWSGTNSKGKFGVFPRSHVDEGTLRDDMRPGTAMGTGGGNTGRRKKESGGKGGMSLFGVRRRASVSSTRSEGGITEII
ncbi:hypothetical protein N0V93_008257 [Gnomoniopsis smithogilvyi]|uniref:SH3 domain-containing protein n=1 Tax=Gnomoniopsis smithogilvyi TaxID=1191159 RepID=A0A9W9CTI6_9PEZI|nr:hypothetical protein N0V93_008257 [Gnomoniopsis smithogilvyi]